MRKSTNVDPHQTANEVKMDVPDLQRPRSSYEQYQVGSKRSSSKTSMDFFDEKGPFEKVVTKYSSVGKQSTELWSNGVTFGHVE